MNVEETLTLIIQKVRSLEADVLRLQTALEAAEIAPVQQERAQKVQQERAQKVFASVNKYLVEQCGYTLPANRISELIRLLSERQ